MDDLGLNICGLDEAPLPPASSKKRTWAERQRQAPPARKERLRMLQNRRAGLKPSEEGEFPKSDRKPVSATAKGYDDELREGNAAAAGDVGAAARASATPRTPRQKQALARPAASPPPPSKKRREEEREDGERAPSPVAGEDEALDVAAAAAAAARSDAALFPEEAARTKNRLGKSEKSVDLSSSSDDDDDERSDVFGGRRRPTGGDGGSSSSSEDDGGVGLDRSLVGSRRGFLSFVDETRTMRPCDRSASSAAEAEERKKKRKQKKREEEEERIRVPAPEQPRRGELFHAGKAPTGEGEAASAKRGEGGKGAKKSKKQTPPPQSFEAAGLSPSTSAHLRSLGFPRPTHVQSLAMPALCAGRDALVKAPTGSGKTLAYLAPIVDDVSGAARAAVATSPSPSASLRGSRSLGSRAVVLCPTRELALQVNDAVSALTRRYHWVVGGALYGGESRSSEKARLRKGITVLVATPGRLLDHLENTASFSTARLSWLVLDEADRLLDLGFEAKVAKVVGILDERRRKAKEDEKSDSAPPSAIPIPERIQTVLVSATMSSAVEGLGGVELRDPARVDASLPSPSSGGKRGDGPAGDGDAAPPPPADESIPETISQRALLVPARAKLATLAALLVSRVSKGGRVLAFFSSCGGVEAAHALLTRGFAAAASAASSGRGARGGGGGGPDDDGGRDDSSGDDRLLPDGAPLLKLHGGMRQAERTSAFLEFSRAKRGGALLATDVAARGLDFPSLALVIQFDVPTESSEYCHRVGRAGRAGERGEAVTFLLPSEARDSATGVGYAEACSGLPPSAAAALSSPGDPLAEIDAGLSGLPLPPPPPLGRRPRFADEHPGVRSLCSGLLDAVSKDSDLRSLAVAGFRASVRSYATFPAAMKGVCHVKRLHLGHAAHCWGLRDAPSVFGRDEGRDGGGGKGGGGKGGKGGKGSGNGGKRKR